MSSLSPRLQDRAHFKVWVVQTGRRSPLPGGSSSLTDPMGLPKAPSPSVLLGGSFPTRPNRSDPVHPPSLSVSGFVSSGKVPFDLDLERGVPIPRSPVSSRVPTDDRRH